MTVSLRSVRAALNAKTSGINILFGSTLSASLAVGATFTHESAPAEEQEWVVDHTLLPKFAQEFTDHVQVAYADECEDDDEPPVSWIFKIANGVQLTALVNGQPEVHWTDKKIKKAVRSGEFDEPIKVELLRDRKKFVGFEMGWVDISTVALLRISH